MSYGLSFSPEFFTGDGYTDLDEMLSSDRPTCVYQALLAMRERDQDWRDMCYACFPEVDPDFVEPWDVMVKIQETNSCTDLRSPVEVWIDPQGWHTVKIYDSHKETP